LQSHGVLYSIADNQQEMTDRVIAEIHGFFSQTLCSEAEADGPR